MQILRVTGVMAVLTWATAASAHYYRTPEVPFPTPERPVAIQMSMPHMPESNYTYVFFYPKYCSGGTEPKMTAYYSGNYPDRPRRADLSWPPPQMANITYCDGKPTVMFFNGMTYNEFRDDVAAGRIVDREGNSPRLNLPDIAYTARPAYIANAGVENYWNGPPKPAPSLQVATPRSRTLSDQLASALAQSFARVPRIQIGLGTGLAAVRENMVMVDIGVQTQEYRFDVQPGAKCVAISGSQSRCTYSVQFSAGGSMMGMNVPTQTSALVTRNDVFDTSGGRYRSAIVDAWTAQLAAVNESTRQGESDSDRRLREDERNRQNQWDTYRACTELKTC